MMMRPGGPKYVRPLLRILQTSTNSPAPLSVRRRTAAGLIPGVRGRRRVSMTDGYLHGAGRVGRGKTRLEKDSAERWRRGPR